MNTCRYCGQKLKHLNRRNHIQFFYCSFCEMEFHEDDICNDRKRKVSVFQYQPFTNIYLTTKEFLECDTITLYHTLKDIRGFWYDIKSLLEKLKLSLDPLDTNKSYQEVKAEFVVLTKKRFVVENILLERTGYIPEKITEDFLVSLIQQSEVSESKPMYIYIK